jgi:enamine deaminase RidA (YjgF/YER057c/UK114 family)
VVDGQLLHPGDAAAQMRVALDTGVGAVISMGGRAEDVVRTRMYVVRRADCEAVGLVHGELFAQVRPAATMVLVSGLIDEAMLVEVELEACVATPEITLPGITKPEMTESELAASPTPSPRPEA